MPASRRNNVLKVDIRSKMGEIIRGKRRNCVYDTADDEIFIKRQRLNSEGDSNDSLDNFPYSIVTTATSQKSSPTTSGKVAANLVSASKAPATSADTSEATARLSPRLRQRSVSGETVKDTTSATNVAVTTTVTAKTCPKPTEEEEEEEDTRELNRRSPNGFLLPDPLPKGETLRDTQQQEWVLGPAIGLGGFGELYLASRRLTDGSLSRQHFVIKVEPHSNGPLFVEIHFYLQSTRAGQLEEFRTSRGIHHLGVPRYIASGSHSRGGQKYRFLVMERFGSDLQRILDHSEGGRFNEKTVCEVALQVLDSLEFIHSQGYVHKDVKASNLLVGLGQQGQHLIHLVDFGLCSKYRVAGGLHKQYTHDLRWAHEGTLEYTSRDAHIGSASRRGDIEVLLYNLIEWLGGRLPWDRDLASPDLTKVAKFRAFASPHKFLRCCFSGGRQGGATSATTTSAATTYSPLLLKLMKYVGSLHFEQEPDYNLMRTLIKQEMSRLGCKQDGRMEYRLGPNNSLNLSAEDGEYQLAAEFLRPLPADGSGGRVSTVFDTMCVSERSWQAARDQLTGERDRDSLANPTQAMLDILEKIKTKPLHSNRKRNKSGAAYYGEGPSHTPAMLEVMKLQQLRNSAAAVADQQQQQLPTAEKEPAAVKLCNSTAYEQQQLPTAVKLRRSAPDEQLPLTAAKLRNKLVDDPDPDPASACLLPPRILPSRSPIPPEVVSLPAGDKLRNRRAAAVGGCHKELARLDPFLPDPEPKRRTRSADVPDSEVSRNLRSAFRFGGLGNMTRLLLRQVSDSFTKMF